MSKPSVIVIKETVVESFAKDTMSAVTLLGAVGVGIWLDSAALQWIAGAVWVLWLFGKASSLMAQNRMTIGEARKRLDEIEAGQ